MKTPKQISILQILGSICSCLTILCGVAMAINRIFIDKNASDAIAWLACALWALNAYVIERERDELAEKIFN